MWYRFLCMTHSAGLLVIVALVSTGCASGSGVGLEPLPRPAGPDGDRSAATSTVRIGLTTTALQLTGIPYREGGATPRGFDCSGFTLYVFAQQGISLPRRAQQQYRAGRSVDVDELGPGDLVFFTTVEPGASHVGLVIDEGTFVHAPSARGKVRLEQLSNAYWARRYLGARRVVE